MVSYSQKDQRPCPVCGATISSEIWMVVHRLERPKLWARCKDNDLHSATCINGHQGIIRAPLLLLDPALPFLIYSPAPGANEAQQAFQTLVSHLNATITPEEKARLDHRVEVVPRDLLQDVLHSPALNAGNFMAQRGTREPLTDLYLAIQHATTEQLELLARSSALEPPVRAAVQFELALTYGRKMRRFPEYSEKTLQFLTDCLEFYNQGQFPHRWATIQSELAIAYFSRLPGNKKENLHEAIHCSLRALDVFTPECFPEDFAVVQSNLANIYMDMVWDYPGAIQKATYCYEEALKIYNRDSYPEDWARVLSNYATAYMTLGDPANLHKAVEALENVLLIRKREDAEEDWALTQMNLGVAHMYLSESPSDAPILKAVSALRSAYEVLGDKERYPLRWVTSSYNLGLALSRTDNPRSLLEAINLLEYCFHDFIHNRDRQNLEHCKDELATCFTHLLKLEASPAAKLELSQRAMSLFEKEYDAEPVGVLLYEIIRSIMANTEQPREKVIDIALKAAQQLLCIYRKQSQLEYRAYGLMHLGKIYLQRPGLNQKGNQTLSLKCFEAAMKIMRELKPSPHRYEVMNEIITLSTLAEQKNGR